LRTAAIHLEATMTDVEIYSTAICPYCVAAKQFLDRKGLSYREVRIDTDPQQRTLMLERSGGRRTVPQIFINGTHVGGFDDLVAAERSGRLDGLIAG
jgi:glutaredoxin 3